MVTEAVPVRQSRTLLGLAGSVTTWRPISGQRVRGWARAAGPRLHVDEAEVILAFA
jgi:hypothetical protein